jgi:hypothetical protein
MSTIITNNNGELRSWLGLKYRPVVCLILYPVININSNSSIYKICVQTEHNHAFTKEDECNTLAGLMCYSCNNVYNSTFYGAQIKKYLSHFSDTSPSKFMHP